MKRQISEQVMQTLVGQDATALVTTETTIRTGAAVRVDVIEHSPYACGRAV